MYAPVVPVQVTIDSGQSLSAEVDIGRGYVLCGLIMPSSWTTASITFKGGVTSGGLQNVYLDNGNELTISADGGRTILFSDPAVFHGLRYVQLRSGTSATPVNQAAARVITLLTKPV